MIKRPHDAPNRCFIDYAVLDVHGRTLGPGGIAVYTALARRAGYETQLCWPSLADLSNLTGISERQVKRELVKLERLALVQIEHRPGRVAIYSLLAVPVSPDTQASESPPRTDSPRLKGVTQATQSEPRPVSPDTQASESYKRKERTKIKEQKEIHVEDSDPYRLANLLREKILANDKLARVPDLNTELFQNWCRDINLLIRKDGRDPPVVESVILWCQNDAFWKSNILSANKLREKFGQLFLRMQEPGKANGQKGNNETAKPAQADSRGVDLKAKYANAGQAATVSEVRQT